MKAAFLVAVLALSAAGREPLEKRIAHTDETKYRKGKAVHGGAGELHYMVLFDASAFQTKLLFLHRGVLPPKGGIGHHYHNHMEEMFIILNGEAEFTIDGRTSRLTGPAAAPCRLGRSHGIYNPTSQPVEWMNIAVASIKGKYDATDLGDNRVGAAIDAKPVFINVRLDSSLLSPVEKMHGGVGTARYRRTLRPEVFYTDWSYVDHLVLPPGASEGAHRHEGVEELYYVVKGAGTVRISDESTALKKGDALPVHLNEVHSFVNTGDSDLEFLIVGVARQKWVLDSTDVAQ